MQNNSFEQQVKVLCTLYFDYSLSLVSTMHTGGNAKYYALVHSISNLQKILILCKHFGVKYMVVGNASNILFLDKGFDGIIICTKGLNKIYKRGNKIFAQAGAMIGNVALFAQNNGLSGLEWSVGIPATIGGAVVMNAGAFGGDINGVLDYVVVLDVFDNRFKKIKKIEYLAQHHKSIFTNNFRYVIISISLNLVLSTKQKIMSKTKDILYKRHQQQNVKYPSLGSVFCRGTSKHSPAFMIEKCSLKGFMIGGAMVSKVHSGYIVNTGNATSQDVLYLINFIKQKIKDCFGVVLDTEIILGE
ncbi:MAG: UDP-N-acetylmuramate dehydrogenase [Clostridia bacterium]|nr:UDP-N-acetylmuramate dehydrogenase [Clostridia bacterium]